MKPVLHIMASGARGGGAAHLLSLLPALRALGVTSHALVGDDGPLGAQLQALGFAVHTAPMMRSRLDAQAMHKLRRHAAALQPAVCHVHGSRAAFYALPARAAPKVYTAHMLGFLQQGTSMLKHAAAYASEALICRDAAAIITVSHADQEAIFQRSLAPLSKITAIGNAIDTADFVPGNQAAARSRLALPPDAFLVGCVARLVPQKAVVDLLDACLLLPKPVHLALVGDGPEATRLRAHPLATQGRAHFLGARDDVAQILPAFDIFALSSHWEAEGIVLLEAMACGLPCVAAAASGPRELLHGAKAGVLAPIGDVRGLADGIGGLRASPQKCAEFAAAGLAYVRARTPAAQAAKVLRVYEGLAGGASLN